MYKFNFKINTGYAFSFNALVKGIYPFYFFGFSVSEVFKYLAKYAHPVVSSYNISKGWADKILSLEDVAKILIESDIKYDIAYHREKRAESTVDVFINEKTSVETVEEVFRNKKTSVETIGEIQVKAKKLLVDFLAHTKRERINRFIDLVTDVSSLNGFDVDTVDFKKIISYKTKEVISVLEAGKNAIGSVESQNSVKGDKLKHLDISNSITSFEQQYVRFVDTLQGVGLSREKFSDFNIAFDAVKPRAKMISPCIRRGVAKKKRQYSLALVAGRKPKKQYVSTLVNISKKERICTETRLPVRTHKRLFTEYDKMAEFTKKAAHHLDVDAKEILTMFRKVLETCNISEFFSVDRKYIDSVIDKIHSKRDTEFADSTLSEILSKKEQGTEGNIVEVKGLGSKSVNSPEFNTISLEGKKVSNSILEGWRKGIKDVTSTSVNTHSNRYRDTQPLVPIKIGRVKNVSPSVNVRVHGKKGIDMPDISVYKKRHKGLRFYKRWRFRTGDAKDKIWINPQKEDLIRFREKDVTVEAKISFKALLDSILFVEQVLHVNKNHFNACIPLHAIDRFVNILWEWVTEAPPEDFVPDEYINLVRWYTWIADAERSKNMDNVKLEGFKVLEQIRDFAVEYFESRWGKREVEYYPDGMFKYNKDKSYLNRIRGKKHGSNRRTWGGAMQEEYNVSTYQLPYSIEEERKM